jgi:hypothetical protein
VCRLSDGRFAAAIGAIDAANAADPTRIMVRGTDEPLALIHGRLAAEWVLALHADAPDEWVIAARAHHLRRWELPRGEYPDGKAGYLRWRRDQKQRHAVDVAALLAAAGYDDDEIGRVQALVRRDGLMTGDPGAQAVEDAACLVFIETQLADIADRLDHDHIVDVIRKTARKMSPEALAAAATIPLAPAERDLLTTALS